jgi:hypothetical protein
MTTREWQKAAVNRMRVIHTPTGTTGNLVDATHKTAVIFTHYETIGALKCPRFERVPLNEIQPEETAK